MIMSTLEDEETQKKGFALVAYNVAGNNIVGKTDFRTVAAGAWVSTLAWPRSITSLIRKTVVHYLIHTPCLSIVCRC